MSLNTLSHRVCVVTGGAQGIGWAVTDACARAGARVYACDISETYLQAAEQRCKARSYGAQVSLSCCDVSNGKDLERWIAEVVAAEGRIDVLVNNAAFVRWDHFEAMTIEETELTMRVGFMAMAHAVKLVLPLMRAQGSGHIVNMGSSAGRVITVHASAPYAAVKAAVEAYTETLRLELQDSLIHVTLVRPGVVAGTGFFRERVPSSRLPRFTDFVSYVTPPQVAQAIINALARPRAAIDIPGSLHFFYLLYAISPGTFRWLISLGGHAQRDLGAVFWDRDPQDRL